MSKGSTGLSTTLTLSTNTVIGRIRSLRLPAWVAESVDLTGLDSTNFALSIPGGPADPGFFQAEVYFDSALSLPTLRVVQTAVITFPLQLSSNTSGASLTGTGFLTELDFGGAALNDAIAHILTFRYDGIGTPPAFAIES